MDSIDFIHGYGKVNTNNDLEEQTPKASPKQRVLVAISSLLFFCLLIGLAIGTLFHSSPEPPTLTSDSADSTIRVVCSVTRFPDACVSSITAANANHSPESGPVAILKISIEAAMAATSKLASSLRSMNSDDAATRDCRDLVEEAMTRLNDSANEVVVGVGSGDHGDLTAEKMRDLQTWIGAAATDEETCLDGLEETRSAVFDDVKVKMEKSKQYISNALAIVANFQSILDKLKNMPRH